MTGELKIPKRRKLATVPVPGLASPESSPNRWSDGAITPIKSRSVSSPIQARNRRISLPVRRCSFKESGDSEFDSGINDSFNNITNLNDTPIALLHHHYRTPSLKDNPVPVLSPPAERKNRRGTPMKRMRSTSMPAHQVHRAVAGGEDTNSDNDGPGPANISLSTKNPLGPLIDEGFALDKRIKLLNQQVQDAKLAAKYESDNQEPRLTQLSEEWRNAAQISAQELFTIMEQRSDVKLTMTKMLRALNVDPRAVFPEELDDEDEDDR